MANEEKSLLLKDLCAKLPYAVKYKTYLGDVFTLKDITFSKTTTEYYIDDNAFSVDQIKPFLRPMSSMTEDEKQEYMNLIVNTGGKRGLGYCLAVTRKRESVEPHPEDSKYSTPPSYHECQDWLNAHHFDYRGLISMGLALEAPEGMYR